MIKYSSLTEVQKLHIYHVVREGKRQYDVGEIIIAPFKKKRDFSHWPSYKQSAEALLEEERLNNYPDLPSREDCLFACLDEESALNWARNKYSKGGVFYLYELEILEGKIINLDTDFFEEASLIIGDKKGLIYGKYSLDDCIKNFWEGVNFRVDATMRELLVYGEIKVISKTRLQFNKLTNEIIRV